MSDYSEKLAQLQQRLDKMVEYQGYFDKEINYIRSEIKVLRTEYQRQNIPQTPPVVEKPTVVIPPIQPLKEPQSENYQTPIFQTNYSSSNSSTNQKVEKQNLEKYIGENLISKIGIAILIIGVGIGAKYAIDNNWITPIMRIVFGYLVGLGLIGFAVKLKPKYLSFSSVLLSGGMATMYFITYFAYSYYHLISQLSAFSVMVIFTIFTVLASILYNQQIIAHIGLVGAYAVPFLLSENSGKVEILFSYMAIINVGILAVSTKKYWKSLFYSSFILTWVIYASWFLTKFEPTKHFTIAFTFLSIFFLIFYATFLIYKLLNHQTLDEENILFILLNSAIFYGFGYAILNQTTGWENYLGLFTILNAFLHFGIGFLLKQLKLGDKITFYLTVILVLTFTSISFPIQTKGNWVTLFWTAEAAILFWIGRTRIIPLFENYSYPIMFLSSISLLIDWTNLLSDNYSLENPLNPFFNKYFAIGLFFVLGFAFINWINRNKNYNSALPMELAEFAKYAIAGVFLFVLYNIFRIEIGNYFYLEELRTSVKFTTGNDYLPIETLTNPAIGDFKLIWELNYTMFFLIVLGWLNIKKFKNGILGYANLGLNAFITFLFLTIGLYVLSYLRFLFLQNNNEHFHFGFSNIAIRYITIPFVLLLFWTSYKYIKVDFINRLIPFNLLIVLFDIGFYFSLWIIVSSELLHWMDIFSVQDSYKLGISILWGVYSLTLIILGIYYRKTHLRIGAIVLFSLTLVKLFLYDLSDLGTISKTIVFVSLGILLLIISFLYNKYKSLIFDEPHILNEKG